MKYISSKIDKWKEKRGKERFKKNIMSIKNTNDDERIYKITIYLSKEKHVILKGKSFVYSSFFRQDIFPKINSEDELIDMIDRGELFYDGCILVGGLPNLGNLHSVLNFRNFFHHKTQNQDFLDHVNKSDELVLEIQNRINEYFLTDFLTKLERLFLLMEDDGVGHFDIKNSAFKGTYYISLNMSKNIFVKFINMF